MDATQLHLTAWQPGRLFYFGLALVLLAMWLPFVPSWQTFIHMWRTEIAASLFLSATLIFLYVRSRKTLPAFELFPDEWKLIVLPLIAFTLWSLISASWAESWKSAIHHSFIWAEYLAFYLLFRQIVAQKAGFDISLRVIVLVLVLYAVPAIVEYCAYISFGGPTTLGMRFGKYGEQIVTLLPLVLVTLVRKNGRHFVIGTVAVVLLWLLVFCTFGRANYFLFGCGVLGTLALLLISPLNRRAIPKFSLVVLLLLIAPLPLHIFSFLSPEGSGSAVTRFTASDGLADSNNVRKLLIQLSTEMVRDNPVLGVGADNFGMQVNRYREAYGAANPGDVTLSSAEDQIPAHAHNEFLQIIVELGIVGGVFIAWLLVGIGVMAFKSMRRIRSGPLDGPAAILGLGMFFASSLVSAYSFRSMQNGIVFFFVLAVGAVHTLGRVRNEEKEEARTISANQLRVAFAGTIIACVGLILYSTVRISSVIVTNRANQTRPIRAAVPLYQLAMSLDDENPDPHQNLGMRLFHARRYADAVSHLRSAISIGRAPSAELSYLATSESLAGDHRAAEETFSLAAAMYPRSPFVLARYSSLLANNGKDEEAERVFSRAVAIDAKAAYTWQALINSGPKAVTEMAVRDPKYSPVMDLRPRSSIYAVVTERFIRYPEEQRFSASQLPPVEE